MYYSVMVLVCGLWMVLRSLSTDVGATLHLQALQRGQMTASVFPDVVRASASESSGSTANVISPYRR